MDGAQRASVVLLWDIDGTLITHAPAPIDRHMRAASKVLGQQTTKVPAGVGKTDRQIVLEIMANMGVRPDEALISEALKVLDAITSEDLEKTPSKAIPGVAGLLEAFRKQGIQQVLLTGNTPGRARTKITSAGLAEFFTFDEGFYGAHARDRYEMATQARNALSAPDEPDRTGTLVVLGDTPLDVRAGRLAGMLTVSVATGIFEHEVLVQESPDLALRDFSSDQHLLISYVASLTA